MCLLLKCFVLNFSSLQHSSIVINFFDFELVLLILSIRYPLLDMYYLLEVFLTWVWSLCYFFIVLQNSVQYCNSVKSLFFFKALSLISNFENFFEIAMFLVTTILIFPSLRKWSSVSTKNHVYMVIESFYTKKCLPLHTKFFFDIYFFLYFT